MGQGSRFIFLEGKSDMDVPPLASSTTALMVLV